MENGIVTRENSLAISEKIKHTVTVSLSNSTSIEPRRLKTHPHKNLHVNVHSSIAHNKSQKQKQSKRQLEE